MHGSVRDVVAVIAVLTGGLLAGCGEDKPPAGALAQVRDNIITKTDVQRAIVGRLAIRHSADTMPPYLPTDFKGCVATKSKRSSGDLADVERRCEDERDRAERAALRSLIHGQWYALEAREQTVRIATPSRGVRLSSAHAGVGAENLKATVRTSLLLTALLAQTPEDPMSVSNKQITRHYQGHRARYVIPDKRYITAVIAPTRAQAQAAAGLLRRGISPEQVTATDSELTLPFKGRRITLLAGGARLQGAARQVPRGEVDVVKVPTGWYVFRVETVLPARRQSLEEARSLVLQDLEFRRYKERVAAYNKRLRSRYREDTLCASGYELPDCA